MTDRYAVFGNPIEHSKSPLIHRLFAEQTGQALSYEKQLVAVDGFAAALATFREQGGKGLNVTVPFKQDAWAAMDELSERARVAGAVNTVLFRGDQCYGDNTDGAGLVRDLRNNHGVELTGKRVLLVGAGGAVRGVLPAVLAELPASVTVANRTAARAESLAAAFTGAIRVRGCGLEALEHGYEIVINGTSAGLNGQLPPLPEDLLVPGAVCYDMVYGNGPTVFQRWAKAHGAALALDGLGMLVEQAAEAFYLWREISPDTAPVIDVLRQQTLS